MEILAMNLSMSISFETLIAYTNVPSADALDKFFNFYIFVVKTATSLC